MKTDYFINNNFIKHDGGTCPVAKGTLIDVLYRDGYISKQVYALTSFTKNPDNRLALFWKHYNAADDIIAWRFSESFNQSNEPVGYAPREYLDNIDEEHYVLSRKQKDGIYDTPLYAHRPDSSQTIINLEEKIIELEEENNGYRQHVDDIIAWLTERGLYEPNDYIDGGLNFAEILTYHENELTTQEASDKEENKFLKAKLKKEKLRADSWVEGARDLVRQLGVADEDSNGSCNDWSLIKATCLESRTLKADKQKLFSDLTRLLNDTDY